MGEDLAVMSLVADLRKVKRQAEKSQSAYRDVRLELLQSCLEYRSNSKGSRL